MGYKYIMLKDKTGKLLPVIFPDSFVHADVFDAIRMGNRVSCRKAGVEWTDPTVVSAGTVDTLRVLSTYGDSETLTLKSHKEDVCVINEFQYSHGLGYSR